MKIFSWTFGLRLLKTTVFIAAGQPKSVRAGGEEAGRSFRETSQTGSLQRLSSMLTHTLVKSQTYKDTYAAPLCVRVYVCVFRRTVSICCTWGKASGRSWKRRKGGIATWQRNTVVSLSLCFSSLTRYTHSHTHICKCTVVLWELYHTTTG